MYDYENPKLGDIVYPAFEPKKPGKIIKIDLAKREKHKLPADWTPEAKEAYIEKNRRIWSTITLQTVKGPLVGTAIHLKCFQSLVDETQKKADNHKARLKALQEMP